LRANTAPILTWQFCIDAVPYTHAGDALDGMATKAGFPSP